MKKVIVCKEQEVVESVCHTDINIEKEMIMANAGCWWYLLSALPLVYSKSPPVPKAYFWKAMDNSQSGWGGEYINLKDAITDMMGYKIYSFDGLDEFIKFYQEKK